MDVFKAIYTSAAVLNKLRASAAFNPLNTSVVGTLLLVLVLYWVFYVPYSWTKQIDDVSYGLALRKVSAKNKRDAINRMRRLRRVGIAELPPPYPNGWYGVLESSALKPGESKSVACLGEQFVVYRTLEGVVHVLDAYCPHLGANLGMGGRVVGDSIECPFHLWSFRGSDGKCDNIPYTNCIPATAKVRKWTSREVNDNIFVWYHAEGDAETPWPLPVVDQIASREYVYHGRNEFYVNCHIQEIPENGADLQHFRAIHTSSLLAGGTDPRSSAFENLGVHRWDAVWKPSESPTKHLAAVSLNHSIELTAKLHVFQMDVVGQQIGPSYVQLHMNSPTFGRFVVLQTVTPIEPLVQKVVHRFYGPRVLAPFMKFAILGESIMFERDMAMWNHKKFCNKPQLVREDALLKSFRSWFAQFYSENSKTFAEARDNLEW